MDLSVIKKENMEYSIDLIIALQLNIAVFSSCVHVCDSFYVSVYGHGFNGGGWKLVCMCL